MTFRRACRRNQPQKKGADRTTAGGSPPRFWRISVAKTVEAYSLTQPDATNPMLVRRNRAAESAHTRRRSSSDQFGSQARLVTEIRVPEPCEAFVGSWLAGRNLMGFLTGCR